ncbi:MAG: cyclase family protein [Tessaracoccus sp.]
MIELSHVLAHGTQTFPGFPSLEMRHHISFDESRSQIVEGRQFAIDLITLIGGSGTYMDAPRHFDPDGADISEVPLERLVDVPAVVVPAPADGRREYQPDDFTQLEVNGHAVLLATGAEKRESVQELLEVDHLARGVLGDREPDDIGCAADACDPPTSLRTGESSEVRAQAELNLCGVDGVDVGVRGRE